MVVEGVISRQETRYVYNCQVIYTLVQMRTNIDIDDALLSKAMAATGLPTKRATVEEGLKLLVRLRSQVETFNELKGIGWDGDLNKMRLGRTFKRRAGRR